MQRFLRKQNQFWVLPLPKWDKSAKELSIRALASKQSIEDIDYKGLLLFNILNAIVSCDDNIILREESLVPC